MRLRTAGSEVLELDLLVNEIGCPDSQSVVVDGQELRVRLVVEGYLVGGVSSDWVAAESLACGDLKHGLRDLNN